MKNPIGGHPGCLTQESTLKPTVQLILTGSMLSFDDKNRSITWGKGGVEEWKT